MVCSHRCSAEEGTSAPLLPEAAEEVWKEPQHPQILLHLHCGEHPDITAGNRKALQRVVRTACHIVGGELPSLQDIYTRRCIRKARRIIKDSSQLSHSLLSLLPSGRRLRSILSRTSRLRDSFFPQAIRLTLYSSLPLYNMPCTGLSWDDPVTMLHGVRQQICCFNVINVFLFLLA